MPAAVSQQTPTAHVEMSYLDAVVQAQIEEMERDERVILLGEDLAVYGAGDLLERFDETRIWSTPISEGSFTGIGIGAAIAGMRPIVDLGIASFLYLASDQIINQASKLRYMTGGQVQVPIVFRCTMYYGEALAAQHSDRPYPVFLNIPGLKIVSPTTPADMKGLLKAAIRADDPVLVFEDTKLWPVKGPVPSDPEIALPIGQAVIRTPGSDVTLVAIAGAMRPALEATKMLSAEGVSVEVIDPRTLKPLDTETIVRSVAKTGHLVVVENAHRMGSLSSEISAVLSEEAFGSLKRPAVRLTAPDVHVPFSPILEKEMFPNKDRIVAAIKRLL
jgi:pyruvate/2-oxoglutarate/acetoin dehydrogenase E1 component